MKYLLLDYETRSEVDLKEVGSFVYAKSPTTEILCVGWKLLDENKRALTKTKVWSPLIPESAPNFDGLIGHICDPDVTIVAHNALFEQVITRYVFFKYAKSHLVQKRLQKLEHEKWVCTAAMAAALALPRKLEKACLALNLPVEKDMEGHRLMLKLSKPRRATKHNSAKWHEKREDLVRLMEYCGADIVAEWELFKRIPMLSDYERKVWLLDQEINFRGFLTDQKLVDKALVLADEESKLLNQELISLTNGAIETTDKVSQLVEILRREGVPLNDLQKNTVKEMLKRPDLSARARRLLELRQAGAKTSTKKYQAFKASACEDGRIRDFLMYHGASTGRWTGRRVQPHNFPQGSIKDYETLTRIIMLGDLEMLRLCYGSPLEALSSALRPVIISPIGSELFFEDFSAIEARVILWLAGDEEGLEVYRQGLDAYRKMASMIFGVPLEEIPPKGKERELGKRAELGCGFGMGWKKFLETCLSFGDKDVTPELAQRAVKAYRSLHAPVVKMWSNVEKAAIFATLNPGKVVGVNKTRWFLKDEFLWCELPSGRRLAYYKPEVRSTVTPWGEERQVLYHWSEHPVTRQWVCEGTYGGRLTENIVQAVARDFMVEAKFRVRSKGYAVILSVHDEVGAEKENGDYVEYQNLMRELPLWGKGCPIKTEGWRGFRYHK